MNTPIDIGRQVIREEAEAMRSLANELGTSFTDALQTIRACTQVVVTGLGKSGHIAQKIAASMTSTGTPALFMHPVEALHGDLGIVTPHHCLIALSRSGNTDEIVRFVAHFRRLGGPVVGVTQGRESKLAELSRHVIYLPDVPESGPLQLAPTTSCITQLAVGDAIAMALLHARGFAPEDFAQYHPEGTLGRRILMRAEDLMHGGDNLPLARAQDGFVDLLHVMTAKRLGMALIVSDDGAVAGAFTDGDLRRLIERVSDPMSLTAGEAHARSRRTESDAPVRQSTVAAKSLAVDCLRIMRESQITSLIVANDDGHPVGLLRLVDLLDAGLG